jgi:CRISPR-associated protein Cst1
MFLVEKINVKLKDFLFNAGICGFLKVLRYDHYDLEDQEIGNSIEVPVSFLDNFGDKYIKAMLDCFQKDTLYQSLITQYDRFSRMKLEEIQQKEYEEFVSKLISKISSASYKSGYAIITSQGDTFDMLSYVKQLKEEKDIRRSLSICEKIVSYMLKHKETLCMKDIIYTKINMFWQGLAFLNSSNSKKDIKECYYKDFVKPAQTYLGKKSKGDLQCIQCGSPLNATLGRGMSWLNDMGIDMGRKRSHYWNFKPDTYLCPICALIYSCIPLGFAIVGSDAIFINNNESIHELVAVNNIHKKGGEVYNTLNELYYKVLYSFIDIGNQIQTKEIQNIQIIKRISPTNEAGRYVFNTLSQPLLKTLEKSKNNFRHLLNWSYKQDKDSYVSVYQEVADNFFSGRNQYSLIHNILQKVFNENIVAPYVKDILSIQRRQTRKFYSNYEGGSFAMYVSKDEFDAAYKAGSQIRMEYSRDIAGDQDKQKKINEGLRSFVYPLLLSLKTKDQSKFSDTLFRFYVGRSQSIPKILINMQLNDEKFQLLGYTFVAGLQGESYDSKRVLENNIEKEDE